MSHRVSAWAWGVEIEDAGAKLLLVKLADSANDDGICWPSQRTLAAHLGLNERSVRYKLELLLERKLVEIVRNRRADGKLAGNVYHLQVPRGNALPLGQRQHVAGASGNTLPVTSGNTLPVKNRNYEPSSEPGVRDAVWDELVEIFGEPTNRNLRGKRNTAVKLIKESLGEGDPSEVRVRARRWEQTFPGATFTDVALANQWDRLGHSPEIPDGRAGVRALEEHEREEREAEAALALPPEESRAALRELMESFKFKEV